METAKNVKIELVQQGNESKKIAVVGEVQSHKISEVGGTIANRILKLHRNATLFGQKLNFSFSRKFDVKLTIDGKEISGTSLMNGAVEFGLTVQNKEKSIERFCMFIESLVTDVLTGENQAVYEMDEVLEEAKSLIEA